MAFLKAVILVLTLGLLTCGFPISHLRAELIPSYPDLLDAELRDLVHGLERGDFSSVQLTKAYISRISETNSAFHAVTEINPDAVVIAATLDAERCAGNIRGPLHGIPMLIKDLIATKDKMNNTAGSYALLGAKVGRDSTVVAKLRAAGVIILGKSNLSQWANYRSGFGNNSDGWSAYGGQVTGAYYPNMSPAGSSSGSAVAASLGLAWATLGTETDGSIVMPSSKGNVVGIKPTVGLTSRSLVVPISEHYDTVGPIARTVKDAAYVLAAIVGIDSNDNYTSAIPFNTIPDYVNACRHSALRGARIGVPRNVIPEDADPTIMAAFEAAILVMKNAGATIVENSNFTAYDSILADIDNPIGNFHTLFATDYYSNIPKYLSQLLSNPQNIHNVQDMQNFTHTCPLEQFPNRNTALWDSALKVGLNNTSPIFWPAYQSLLAYAGSGGVTGAMASSNLDALILPTNFSPLVPALGGFPIISVPMGSYPSTAPVTTTPTWGLVDTAPSVPFSISFISRAWSEESLIGYAYAYEQRTHFRRKITPYSSPSSGLGNV